MMNPTILKKSLAICLFLGLVVALSFTACSTENPLEEMNENAPSLRKGDGNQDIDPPRGCAGTYPFHTYFAVVPVTDYPGYDLGIRIQMDLPNLPTDCVCESKILCLSLELPMEDVLEVGATYSGASNSPITTIYNAVAADPMEFASGKEDDFFPMAVSGTINPEPFNICYEVGSGDLLLFNVAGNLSGAFSTEAVVASLGGICIIDNIDNPNDG